MAAPAIRQTKTDLRHPEDFLPTGLGELQKALGLPGIPRHSITHLYGPFGSGKRTLALYLAHRLLAKGHTVAWIDAARAISESEIRALGLDLTGLVILRPSSIEEALGMARILVSSTGAPDLVILDSPGALPSQAELESPIGQVRRRVFAENLARELRVLRERLEHSLTAVLVLDELRPTFEAPRRIRRKQPPEPEVEPTSAGKAVAFWADVRLRVSRVVEEREAGTSGTAIESDQEKRLCLQENRLCLLLDVTKNRLGKSWESVILEITSGPSGLNIVEVYHEV